MKINVAAITLQQNQRTKRVRVILEKGDSIRSWVSSNKKIVTVDRNGLIKAQNRSGRATITCQEKVTYTSSNSKVATVNNKGVITAKKKGTAKITVKCGKQSYVVKVTVK